LIFILGGTSPLRLRPSQSALQQALHCKSVQDDW